MLYFSFSCLFISLIICILLTERGARYSVSPPLTGDDPLYGDWCDARGQLCDALSDVHHPLAEHIVTTGDFITVPKSLLFSAVKQATVEQVM